MLLTRKSLSSSSAVEKSFHKNNHRCWILFIYSSIKHTSFLNGRVLFSFWGFNYCSSSLLYFYIYLCCNFCLFPDNFAIKNENLENIFMDSIFFFVFLFSQLIICFLSLSPFFRQTALRYTVMEFNCFLERPQNKLTTEGINLFSSYCRKQISGK